MKRFLRNLWVIVCLCLSIHQVYADSGAFKPQRIVKIVVPFSSGGSADVAARLLAEKLSTLWSQSVIIDNKPGGGTTVASAYVAQSVPDGHTLYLGYLLSYATSAALYRNLPYNPMTALKGVSLIVDAPFILSVSPHTQVNDLSDFIKFAKNNKALSYSSTGNGAGPHLATEVFLRRAGLKATQIPYKGSSEAITSLMSQLVEFSFFDATALGVLKSGKVTPIAVTSLKRWQQLPLVPTIAESGYPGFNITSSGGILVPSKTPMEIIQNLNRDIVNVMSKNDIQQKFMEQGFVTLTSTPEDFDRTLKAQLENFKTLINDLGLRTD